MYGVIGWICIVPFGIILFYAFFIPAFNILLRKKKMNMEIQENK